MTTPVFTLPTSGSDPKRTTKEGLEENINQVIQYLDNARIVGDDRATEGFYNAGSWDASMGTFPTVRGQGGSVQNGDTFRVSVAGVVDGETFAVDQRLIAQIDGPSSTTYTTNWERANTVAILEPLTTRVDDMAVPFDTVVGFINDTTLSYSDTTVGTDLTFRSTAVLLTVKPMGTSLTGKHLQNANGLIAEIVPFGNVYPITAWGVSGDGSDETASVVKAVSAMESGDVLDLCWLEISIFNSVAGEPTVSDEDARDNLQTNAAELNEIPRFYQQDNVTIQNGMLYAANPSTAGTKSLFPTTLTMDECTDMQMLNVTLRSKGESWGDSDASRLISKDTQNSYRREFCAMNGGHAFLFSRSKGLRTVNCRYERCGSVSPFYSMSSDGVVLSNDYATAESLGYAAYAFDSWAGGISYTGFDKHRSEMHDCRSDDNGATYGSKGCIATEDADVDVLILGGVFKDAWPNGGAKDIGYGVMSNVSTVTVIGAHFENVASMGCTDMSVDTISHLKMISCTSKNLRTAGHIQRQKSFGRTIAEYVGCQFDISGTVTWDDVPELSVPTLIANRKTASRCFISMDNCLSSGAHTLAVNSSISYGGLRISGGHHTVSDRIMDSEAWGSSQPDEYQGLEILGGATIVVTEAVSDASITEPSRSDLILKPNQSGSSYTYQTVNIDDTVTIDCREGFHSLLRTPTTGGTALDQKQVCAAKKIGCYQTKQRGLGPHMTSITVVSLDGVSGSNSRITVAMDQGTFVPNGATFYDDTGTRRELVSSYAGADATSGQLEFGYFLDTPAYNVTVGDTYVLTAGD